MITDYQQLLRTPEWRGKTIEILKRDSHTCQRCGTRSDRQLTTHRPIQLDKILKTSEFFYESFTSDKRNIRLKLGGTHKGFLCKSPHSVQELRNSDNLVFLFQTVWKDAIKYPFKATLGKLNFDPDVHNQIEIDPLVKLFRVYLKKNFRLDVDLEGVYIMRNDVCKESIYSKDSNIFQVHHMCYRKGIEIWEHPNEEYVTLCNVCHDIVHENQDIPFYDERGREIQDLEKCDRCGGKGYMPEYRHVENGVCFKCRGTGYND